VEVITGLMLACFDKASMHSSFVMWKIKHFSIRCCTYRNNQKQKKKKKPRYQHTLSRKKRKKKTYNLVTFTRLPPNFSHELQLLNLTIHKSSVKLAYFVKTHACFKSKMKCQIPYVHVEIIWYPAWILKVKEANAWQIKLYKKIRILCKVVNVLTMCM